MKTPIIIAICALLSLNIYAQQMAPPAGQPKRTPEEMADQRTKKLTEKLALNADQQSKVKALLITDMKKMQDMRATQDGDRKEHMQAMRAGREESDKEMKKILTDEQWKKLQDLRKEEQEARKERFNGQRSGGKSNGNTDDAY